MSDTTAMIDVTATILPRTVISDRSFAPQIASSAMPADSMTLFTDSPNHEERPSWLHLSVLRRRVDLDGRAFLQVAHRIVRTGDDLIARFQSHDDLEVFVARDTHLDWHELDLAAPHDEDAFGLLPRLSGLELRGRSHRFDARGPSPAPAVGRRFHDLPVVVEHELAHGDGGNRHGRHVLSDRRRDVSGAREALPHVRNVAVDHDDDLEVGRLPRPRVGARGLNRAVADFRDMAGKALVGQRVDRDLRELADHNVGNVALIHLDFCLNHAHIGQREENRAGVVHRADHSGLALLDVPARDDPVDWRFDANLAQVVSRVLEARALLLDARFLRRDLVLPLVVPRLVRSHIVFRSFERFARRQLLLPQILLAIERLLGLIDLHARGLNRLALLVERRFGGVERRTAAVHARPERPGVDLQEELTPGHALPFADREIDDAAGRLGGDVDEPLRLDFPGRRDDRLEVARL